MEPPTELLDDFPEIARILFDDPGFLQTRRLRLRNFPASFWSVRIFHGPTIRRGDERC
jgi:hypothetical protein